MIGIIGFGRFGKLTAQYLAADFDVRVYDPADLAAAIRRTGAHRSSLKTVCGCEVVILCVPIRAMRNVLRQIASLLDENVLVVDVCSVKEYPVKWMQALLPERASILATHPMFGPDSASGSLQGRKIFLNPVRITEKAYRKIKTFLAARGLIIIEGSARQHDEQIAVSLALTHFIGRTLSEFGAPALEIDTEGYQRLRQILEVVENDTWQLFVDMHRYNPYAKEKRRAFMDIAKKINAQLQPISKEICSNGKK
jgi:prephenate dehydrogenase